MLENRVVQCIREFKFGMGLLGRIVRKAVPVNLIAKKNDACNPKPSVTTRSHNEGAHHSHPSQNQYQCFKG